MVGFSTPNVRDDLGRVQSVHLTDQTEDQAWETSGPGAGGKSVSSFAIHATLYSDGTATGHVDCVDPMGDTSTGNIFGEVTGKLVAIPGGHPIDRTFKVTIQSFGGAGVGHCTLGNPAHPFCIELLLSGQIVETLN